MKMRIHGANDDVEMVSGEEEDEEDDEAEEEAEAAAPVV